MVNVLHINIYLKLYYIIYYVKFDISLFPKYDINIDVRFCIISIYINVQL